MPVQLKEREMGKENLFIDLGRADLLSRRNFVNSLSITLTKTRDYSFMVPNTAAVDYQRIADERYKDAVAGGYYASDAFMVTSKELPTVFVGVSTKFLSRFTRKDCVTLYHMPFFFDHRLAGRIEVNAGWGEDYGISGDHYRFYFIGYEDIPAFKAELDAIREIHVPHFKVNVSTL
jgi:hypothetical protein